jgi:hypothetical protein
MFLVFILHKKQCNTLVFNDIRPHMEKQPELVSTKKRLWKWLGKTDMALCGIHLASIS